MLNSFTKLILFVVLFSFWSCGDKKQESTSENKNDSENPETENNDNKKKELEKPEETAENALKSIKSYFESLTGGNYEKASESFAENVKQWITIKDTDPKAIAKEAKRFLSSKNDVKYTLNIPSFLFNDNKASVIVSQDWAGYHATLEVLLEFDTNAKIISYEEGKIFDLKKVNTNAKGLEKFLKNTPKLSLPAKIESTVYGDYKEIQEEDRNFLGLELFNVMAPELYQYVGYFDLKSNKVGIIYSYVYRTSVLYTLVVFDKKTGKLLSREEIGSAGGGHIVYGYDSNCETSITEDGQIKVYFESGTVDPETYEFTADNSSAVKYKITSEGEIKKQ